MNVQLMRRTARSAVADTEKSPNNNRRVQDRTSLLAFALGPTTIIRSSASQRWPGILLERHAYLPGERTSSLLHEHVISMSNACISRLQHRNGAGELISFSLTPQTIMITPGGIMPEIRLHTPADVTHCALDTMFVERVREELGCPKLNPVFRAAARDRSIRTILAILMDELETEHSLGQLYIASLAHALAARYILLARSGAEIRRSKVTGLVPRVLNRVCAKIEANLDADLSLESLAEESGYSRAHFLRAFRASTGATPHQYVLNLRLRRAQECLRRANSTIVDVALSCGFSSQSHLTTVFKRHFEMTPGEFRRSG